MKARGKIITMLAVRDCREEWPSAVCMVLSIAAVLIPIIILLSIRAGIIGQLRDELVRSPKSRELLTIGEPVINPALVLRLQGLAEVEFVVPRTRFLSAGAVLRSNDTLTSAEVDIVPSGTGDPLLRLAWRPNGAALSETAARKLGAKVGKPIAMIVNRTGTSGSMEIARVTLTVNEIVSHERVLSGQSLIYVPARLNEAIELWREDPTVSDLSQALGRAQAKAATRKFAGLRIYADDVDAVEAIRSLLAQEGIDVQSRAADIRTVQRLSRSMTIFISALATFMIGGLVLALGGIQWGWVERKRVDYSYLRLLGLKRRDVGLIPIIQAVLMVLPAALLAVGTAFVAQLAINRLFAGQVGGIGAVSKLPWAETVALIGVAILAAVLAAFVAARNAARVSPIIALRGN